MAVACSGCTQWIPEWIPGGISMTIANTTTTGQEHPDEHAAGRPQGWHLWAPSHLTGVILATAGYLLGAGIAGVMATDEDGAIYDQKLLWGFIGLTLGWLIGVGALNFMFRWLLGLPEEPHEEPYRGKGYYRQLWRY